MGKSIGLLELKSIPVGIETADAVLKAANVELLTATPTCPGKYVIIICGAVGAVKSAMESGRQTAGIYLVGHHTINNVHASVPEAMPAAWAARALLFSPARFPRFALRLRPR